MRNPKTMLALVLAAVVLTAWAGNTVVTRKAKSDKDDRTVVAQVQPAEEKEDEKPDRATQSRPEENQSPKSKDRNAQAPESKSEAAQDSRSEHNAVRAPESRPDDARAPASSERRRTRVVADPTPAVSVLVQPSFPPRARTIAAASGAASSRSAAI